MITLKNRFAILILFMLILPGLAIAQDLSKFEKDIHEYTLDNGLKVIILENHAAPVISFCTMVDAGASNEVVGATGLAHVLEHMAFKGTTQFGVTDYSKEKPLLAKIDKIYDELVKEQKSFNPNKEKIAELEKQFKETQDELNKLVVQGEFMELLNKNGSSGLNAFTGSDMTVFIVSLPANKAEFWAMLESHRFKAPVFREFFKERDVIMEERRLGIENQPVGRLLEELLGISFKAHPYGVTVIGHMSDLKVMTRKLVSDFHHKYYVPSNMTIAIAGDVNPEEMIGYIEDYWGDMPKVEKPALPVTVEPEQLGERTITIKEKTQPFVLIAYHKPSISQEDEIKLRLLGNILGSGRSSRLYGRLVKEEKIATALFSFGGYPGTKYPGLYLFFAMPSKGNSAEKVRDVMFEEIEKVVKEKVTVEELDKVKTQEKASIVRDLSSNLGMAIKLATYNIQTGSWKNAFLEIDKINAVTIDDLYEVAGKYFTPKNRNIAMIVTEEE